MRLAPPLSLAALAAASSPVEAGPPVEVPLVLYQDATYSAPDGVPIGYAASMSFGDLDADGWIDMVSYLSGTVWRNVNGQTWALMADLDTILPPATIRYGVSIADYDRDGLPEMAGEPRDIGGDSCFHLFENLGAPPWFTDVAADPTVLSVQPCQINSETVCFGDVDGDGELDIFLPSYPPQGNFLFHNRGPLAAPRFVEMGGAAGLAIPAGNARPEGAQLCDVDHDGDLDLYSNGAIYQNRSTPGAPLFRALSPAASGIHFAHVLEEGAAFFDHDLDGDMDLALAYTSTFVGIVLLENRGDGSFFQVEPSVVESATIGIGLGLSAADWDGDGDIDFTTQEVFRRNRFVETGVRKFTVATHAIPPAHVAYATPAWGDTDRDGDLDCALGNGGLDGHFYVNTTYDDETPLAARRFVRVRPVRDQAGFEDGLDVEFGAAAEVRIHGDTLRRRQFTASSAGYLNQNEYTLTFGLPADPTPADPATDLRFDVAVDFPGAADAGVVRVDRHVNPLLGDLHLADLDDREVVVSRDGRVTVSGCDVPAAVADDPVLRTTGSGLSLAAPGAPLPGLAPAPAADWWVGLEVDLTAAPGPVRLAELILDGRLDAPVPCGGSSFNVAFWDVGGPLPVPVTNGTFAWATSDRNRRSSFPLDLLLAPGTRYRVAARVTERRASPMAAPIAYPELALSGGFEVQDSAPCTGAAVAAAPLDATQVHLALRFRADDDAWFELGQGSGIPIAPRLEGSGPLLPGRNVTLRLAQAPPAAPAALVLSRTAACQHAFAGVLVPRPDVVVLGLVTDGAGSLQFGGTVPATSPAHATLHAQALVLHPCTGEVFLSNAVAPP